MYLYNADVLATAILQRAVLDYQMVKKYGDCAAYNRAELERFFHSPLCGAILGGIDLNWAVTQIRRGNVKKRKPYMKRSKPDG